MGGGGRARGQLPLLIIEFFTGEGEVSDHGRPGVSFSEFLNKILLIRFFKGGGPWVRGELSLFLETISLISFFRGRGWMQGRSGVSSLKFRNKISFINHLSRREGGLGLSDLWTIFKTLAKEPYISPGHNIQHLPFGSG